jgi:spermidine synthase
MKQWTVLDSAETPDGRKLVLAEHDGTYSISVGGSELMSTRKHNSEEKLAQIACMGLRNKRRARVLIGGLGLGFTLRAALAAVGPDATVVQSEILPSVVAWNRNPAYGLAFRELEDKRVEIALEDVAVVIRQSPGGFDAIMLDVDNGPAALTADGNQGLYVLSGLKAARAALRPGGRIVYWAAAPDHPFEKLMGQAGFHVDVQRCSAHTTSGGWHTLYVGQVDTNGTKAAAAGVKPAARRK